MLTKQKTWDLHDQLVTFTSDLAIALERSKDPDEIEILKPILETARSLREEMEVIM